MNKLQQVSLHYLYLRLRNMSLNNFFKIEVYVYHKEGLWEKDRFV